MTTSNTGNMDNAGNTKQKIEELVRNTFMQRTGLDVLAAGNHVLANAIEKRMRVLQLPISASTKYLAILEATKNHNEFDDLLQELLVPETWLNRQPESFTLLASWAKQQFISSGHVLPMRLLSVPCSSGEEPYSIAMSLLDAGYTSTMFSIDAMDISPLHLSQAKRAVYTANAFRSSEKDLRSNIWKQRYFTGTIASKDDKHAIQHLHDSVKQHVNFLHGNALDDNFMASIGQYHVIFCRNLFIYLIPEARKKLLNILYAHLQTKGLLCIGHSESHLILGDKRFSSLQPTAAFTYTKNANEYRKKTTRLVKRKKEKIVTTIYQQRICSQQAKASAHSQDKTSEKNTLIAIQQLADNGYELIALPQCIEYINNNPQDADAYFLLAILSSSTSDDVLAEQSLRKVLYMCPQHQAAMQYLILLLRTQGRHKAAKRMQARLQRLNSTANIEQE